MYLGYVYCSNFLLFTTSRLQNQVLNKSAECIEEAVNTRSSSSIARRGGGEWPGGGGAGPTPRHLLHGALHAAGGWGRRWGRRWGGGAGGDATTRHDGLCGGGYAAK